MSVVRVSSTCAAGAGRGETERDRKPLPERKRAPRPASLPFRTISEEWLPPRRRGMLGRQSSALLHVYAPLEQTGNHVRRLNQSVPKMLPIHSAVYEPAFQAVYIVTVYPFLHPLLLSSTLARQRRQIMYVPSKYG